MAQQQRHKQDTQIKTALDGRFFYLPKFICELEQILAKSLPLRGYYP